MRKRATSAQKQDRIRFVMDAVARDFSDDLIIQALVKQGLSQKQAGRYLTLGYTMLGSLALQQDPVQLGKVIHRANKLARNAYLTAVQDDDPDGKKARVSMAANKSVVDLIKAAKLLESGESKRDVQSANAESTETTELESVLRLFGEQQTAG